MSHDAMAGAVMVLPEAEEKLKSIVPEEFKHFKNMVDVRYEVDIPRLADFINSEPDLIADCIGVNFGSDEELDDAVEDILQAYRDLTSQFREKTNLDIALFSLACHDESQYNEPDEYEWIILNGLQINLNAEKLGVTWDDYKFFAVFG